MVELLSQLWQRSRVQVQGHRSASLSRRRGLPGSQPEEKLPWNQMLRSQQEVQEPDQRYQRRPVGALPEVYVPNYYYYLFPTTKEDECCLKRHSIGGLL